MTREEILAEIARLQGELKRMDMQDKASTMNTTAGNTPVLADYDRNAFDIVGTQLLNYYGNEKDVVIPDGVTLVNGFNDNKRIKSVYIPSSVKVINKAAFRGCDKLKTVTLNEGLLEIGDEAFKNCYGIKEIVLPQSLIELGTGAFSSCGLINATLPTNLQKCGDSLFSNCDSLEAVDILCPLEAINWRMFEGCRHLTSIKLPDAVRSIGLEAFKCCGSLEEIQLPENLANIQNRAFEDCFKLKSVTIPKSVSIMGEFVFIGCRKIKIHCEALQRTEKWSAYWNVSYKWVDGKCDNHQVVWGCKR